MDLTGLPEAKASPFLGGCHGTVRSAGFSLSGWPVRNSERHPDSLKAGLQRHTVSSWRIIMIAAGPTSTTKMPGKMNSTSAEALASGW